MKVTFVISNHIGVNTGVGGHYRSLLAVASELKCSILIVVLGDAMPPVFNGIENVEFINTKSKSQSEQVRTLTFHATGSSIIHTYDYNASIIGMFTSAKLRIPMVVTKPGGQLWRKSRLPWKHMVIFTKADEVNIQSRFLAPKSLRLIPNRVTERSPSYFRSLNPFDHANPDTLKIICIARFSAQNLIRFAQSINLLKELNAIGVKTELALIGINQEIEVLDEVRKLAAGQNVYFRTEKEYTVDASRSIGFADISVASGRAVAEALCARTLIFFPVGQARIPCLLTPDNYDLAASHNFTWRTPYCDLTSEDYSLRKMLSLSLSERLRLIQWGKATFTRDYSARVGADKLHNLYMSVNKPESLTSCYARLALRKLELSVKKKFMYYGFDSPSAKKFIQQ